MKSIWNFIFLLSTLNVHLPTASASPIRHAKGGIYRMTDASDDEFDVAAEVAREFKSSNDQAVASKRRLSPIDDPLEDSDEDSYQIRRQNSQSRKRLKLLSEFTKSEGFRHTGLEKFDASSDANSVSFPDLKNYDDESVTQANDRGDHLQINIKEWLPFEDSDEESIQIRRKDSHSRKRRRVSPESEETAKLKTTGLDLADASSAFTKGNAASPSELKDHDDESATQMNDRGNYYSQTKIKEQNRKLIRETAKFLEDPLQDIEDYEEWLKNVIKAPEEMKKKYDNEMKAKLILHFYKRKIQNKTGILLNKIPWNQLPEDGIILWPDSTQDLFHLHLNQLNEILGRLDQLHLSEEFLRKIKKPKISTGLEKKITFYVRDLLQNVINWEKRVPWDKLTRTDFVNWPEDVPVKRPDIVSLAQRKALNDVLENIKLSEHFKNTYRTRLGYLRSEKLKLISRHILNLINKYAGIPYNKIPEIAPKEITHWPSVITVNPVKLLASELDYVFQNLNTIDLSETCKERLRALFKLDSLKYELRQHILEMLDKISDKRNNIRVPWRQIKRDSVTWWPADVPISNPNLLSSIEVQKILNHKHRIKFTPKFKEEYLKYLDSTLGSQKIK